MAVPDSSLITLLANAGIAGVFVVLFLTGMIVPKSVIDDLRAERDKLSQAVNSERDRADAAVAAAQATRDVFSALQAGADLGRKQRAADRNGGAT